MRIYLTFFLLLAASYSNAQDKSFYEIVTTADSIIAIAHETTSNGDAIIVDQRGNEIRKPDLIKEGQINAEIVSDKIILDHAQIKAFTSLLNSDSKFSIQGTCFNPHHALLIYHEGKMGYIDICFECSSVQASIDYPAVHFDEVQWQQVQLFFADIGLIKN